MNKRGQLGFIELRFFMIGFFIGLIAGLVLTMLGTIGVLPFQIPFICGSIMLLGKKPLINKKGQLAAIEFHFLLGGLVVGLVLALILIGLGSYGVLPFEIPLVCPAPK
jgi:hypothetical protein